MPPFKDLLSADAVRGLAARHAAADPAFPAGRFVAAALDGLDALELKDRVRHVAAALRDALPADWPAALDRLLRAWPAPGEDAGSAFGLWPVLQVVEDGGLDHPEASLAALRRMTERFSAEFAVRPYLERHPELTWRTLEAWTADPSEHVRRLCSEGSRPRLPWGRRLAACVADPSRGLALLDRLVDDPSAYVRRSVANHLGDVAKDHPALAVATARRWMAERPDREEVARHGLRARLKAGDPAALALFGHHPPAVEVRDIGVSPARARIGEAVEVTATLHAHAPTHVRVDLVWAWPGARGGWSSRTFRGADRDLAAGERWTFRGRISTRPVTTRPLRPGEQRVTLRVSGVDAPPVTFTLEP